MALDFGIEIECLIPGVATAAIPYYELPRLVATGLCDVIVAAGVPCNFVGYTHRIEPGQWKIVTDSSISAPAGFLGLEIVSPPLNDDGLGQIEVVCRVLNEMGARVNKTCGLHVHIGAHNMSVPALKRLANLYHDYEESIDGLLPPSRRINNTFCGPLRGRTNLEMLQNARDVQTIQRSIGSGSRYVKLNYAAYFKYRTVEFRQHSGTVDATKITKWVFFCSGLVDLAKKTEGVTRPVIPTAVPDVVELARARIRRARQLRIILDAVARPEGATSVEVQALLGRRTPPALAGDLARIGVAFRRDGRRGGHSVYKLATAIAAPPVIAATPPEETTLPKLLEKMELPLADVQFWNARAELLRGTISSAETETQ